MRGNIIKNVLLMMNSVISFGVDRSSLDVSVRHRRCRRCRCRRRLCRLCRRLCRRLRQLDTIFKNSIRLKARIC